MCSSYHVEKRRVDERPIRFPIVLLRFVVESLPPARESLLPRVVVVRDRLRLRSSLQLA